MQFKALSSWNHGICMFCIVNLPVFVFLYLEVIQQIISILIPVNGSFSNPSIWKIQADDTGPSTISCRASDDLYTGLFDNASLQVFEAPEIPDEGHPG